MFDAGFDGFLVVVYPVGGLCFTSWDSLNVGFLFGQQCSNYYLKPAEITIHYYIVYSTVIIHLIDCGNVLQYRLIFPSIKYIKYITIYTTMPSGLFLTIY